MASMVEPPKKECATMLKYRRLAYKLAYDIGSNPNIYYDQFKSGFQTHDRGTYDFLQERVYKSGKDKIIIMLEVFNELERTGIIAVPTGDLEKIVHILKCTENSDCKRLANEFEENMHEVEQEEFTDSGTDKAFCFFLRNDDFGGLPELVNFSKWMEYEKTFKALGIKVRSANRYVLSTLENELATTMKKEFSTNLILVVMIGYNVSDPIEGSFMMNNLEKATGKKKITWYDMNRDLIEPLMTREFHDKRLVFINITQSLPKGRDERLDEFMRTKPQDFIGMLPRNIAYIHLHSNGSEYTEKIFEKRVMKSWLYTENIVGTMRKIIEDEYKPHIRVITCHDSQTLGLKNPMTETDAVLGIYPKKVLVIKIKLNNTETVEAREFCEYSLGYEKNLLTIAAKTRDDLFDDGERGSIKKKISQQTAPEKKFDFFLLVITSLDPMAQIFYDDAVETCEIALNKYSQTPKLIVVDVALKQGFQQASFAPPVTPKESIIIFPHNRESLKMHQMFISRLRMSLEQDKHGIYSLRKHVLKTFQIQDENVTQNACLDLQLSREIYLIGDKKNVAI